MKLSPEAVATLVVLVPVAAIVAVAAVPIVGVAMLRKRLRRCWRRATC